MNPMKIALSVALLCLVFSCHNRKEDELSDKVKNEIDHYIGEVMQLHGIPGLALAVVKNGQIVYKGHFGKADIQQNTPISENTLFRIYSATKLITTTGVFQLVEKEQISLEDQISKYFDNLPERWQGIRIKHLLTHSSGLPDFIRFESTLSDEELMSELFKAKLDFEAGDQFRYNQTNYWLLAQIIEKVTGLTFEEYVLKNQFDSGKSGVLFSSNSREEISNRALRYYFNTTTKEYEKDTHNNGRRGHPGNGLNITLDEFIKWNGRLDNNKLLTDKTKAIMWAPFIYHNEKDKFLHGWGIYPVGHLKSVGFSGGNVAGFRKFVQNELTIVLLSNGYEYPAYDIIINDIAKIAIPELRARHLTLEKEVMKAVINKKYEDAGRMYAKLKEENPDFDFGNIKWNINSVGNALIRNGKKPEAFRIFKLNAEANPNWWVAFAGLAESFELSGDLENAIENYQKAIQLNENNEWNYNEQLTQKIGELKKSN